MKTIQIPNDIQLINPENGEKGETVSFRSYAFRIWLGDRRALEASGDLTSAEMTERWGRVIQKFKDCEMSIHLEDWDYKTLERIVKNPSFGMGNALVEVQLLPFVLAVIEAENG